MVAAHSPSALRVLRFAARPGELPWRLDHEHGGPGPQRERARSRTCDQGPGSSPTSIERPGVVAGPLRCGGRSETRACRGRSARCRALGEWGSAGCEGEHRVKPRIDDDRGGSKRVKLLPPSRTAGRQGKRRSWPVISIRCAEDYPLLTRRVDDDQVRSGKRSWCSHPSWSSRNSYLP